MTATNRDHPATCDCDMCRAHPNPAKERLMRHEEVDTADLRELAEDRREMTESDRDCLRRAADEIDALRGAPPIAEPSDLAAWNQERLDALRITGSTAGFQENAISPAALAYAQSLDERAEGSST